MSKNERKRTMVYSNVNKNAKRKADTESASKNNEIIDLDEEFVIGLASFPKPDEKNQKKKNKKNKIKKSGQVVENIASKFSKKKLRKKSEEDFDTFIGDERNKENIKKNKKKFLKKITVNQENYNKPQLTKQEKIKMQKRRAIKKMSMLLLLLILTIGGIVYFLLSPVFNVKSIQVVDNNYISSEQIASASEIALNQNTFKFSKKEVKNKILANPYVEKVDVSRNLFTGAVKISVKERTATLMLEYGNSYVYINNQGYILEISGIKIDSPILKGYVTPLEDVKPGNRLNKDDLERLEDVLSIIEEANSKGIGNLITHINIKDNKDYVLIMESEDKTVYLGDSKNLSTKMLYVKDMLQREKGIEGEFFLDVDLNIKDPMFREKV
ncbi:MAG: FtsQ-type POTRA domain-containing protein [Clostridia bacterium]|nr:FtsQ-type POTRA domain-containing protein [Clostridia bacterium]